MEERLVQAVGIVVSLAVCTLGAVNLPPEILFSKQTAVFLSLILILFLVQVLFGRRSSLVHKYVVVSCLVLDGITAIQPQRTYVGWLQFVNGCSFMFICLFFTLKGLRVADESANRRTS